MGIQAVPEMRASESTHWYKRDGSPCYTVLAKDGSPRDTTLRDARKLSLVPSVTTIIKCAAAPGLERWKLDQMLHAALTLPRQVDEKESDWIGRVWLDSQETARKASERGTAIHAAIQERFDSGRITGRYDPQYEEHCLAAENAVFCWDQQYYDAETEESFASPLGYGGKVDLNGKPDFVLDFKTKEFGPEDELKTWDEHHMQLAAYREGLGMPKARCAICYVSVNNPGLSRLIEIPEEDLERGWEMFLYLLGYWKAKNRFNPSWEAT